MRDLKTGTIKGSMIGLHLEEGVTLGIGIALEVGVIDPSQVVDR